MIIFTTIRGTNNNSRNIYVLRSKWDEYGINRKGYTMFAYHVED